MTMRVTMMMMEMTTSMDASISTSQLAISEKPSSRQARLKMELKLRKLLRHWLTRDSMQETPAQSETTHARGLAMQANLVLGRRAQDS